MSSLSNDKQLLLQALQQSIKMIVESERGLQTIRQNHILGGTFHRLCDPTMMKELLFPGAPAAVLADLPGNLREVLQWKELHLDVDKVLTSAAEVFDNSKRRGAAQGDVMDQKTEQLLLPQIAQEALGNQLVQAVRALSRRATAQKARSTLAEAWTPPASSSVSADLNQLSEPTVWNLLSGVEAEAMQRRFLGRDWSRLVREDILRFVACEKMVLAGSSSERRIRREQDQRQGHELGQDENHEATMAWIDPGQDGPLGEEYPALTELLLRLHLLPFEINNKRATWSSSISSSEEATPEPGLGLGLGRLLEPSPGCTSLLRYPGGCRGQVARTDSRRDGGDADSGIRLTCTYHLFAEEDEDDEDDKAGEGEEAGKEEEEGRYVLTSAATGRLLRSVPFQNDQLVLHSSTAVRNERRRADREYFAVIFYILGRDTT